MICGAFLDSLYSCFIEEMLPALLWFLQRETWATILGLLLPHTYFSSSSPYFLSALAPFQSMPKLSFAWATINRLLSWGLLYWDAVWSREARVSSRGGNPSVTCRIPSKCPPNDLWGPVLSGPVPSGISSCPSLSPSLCPCHTGCLSVPPAGHSFWLRACAHAIPSAWRAYLPLLPSGLTSIQFSHWILKVNLLINTPPHTKSYISLCYIRFHNVLLFDVAVCLTALTTMN